MQHLKRRLKRQLNYAGIDVSRKYRYLREAENAYDVQAWLTKQSNMSVRHIVDVGAFDGDTAAKYLGYFPDAEVHAFEPFPDSFSKLESFASADPRVVPVRAALADRLGKRVLYSTVGVQTNSLLEPAKSSSEHLDSARKVIDDIEVEVTTLDHYWAGNEADIDILKLDIQGGELMALEGSNILLQDKRVHMIYVEVEFQEMYTEQPLFNEISGYLRALEYEFFSLFNLNVGKGGRLNAADALFYSPSLRV